MCVHLLEQMRVTNLATDKHTYWQHNANGTWRRVSWSDYQLAAIKSKGMDTFHAECRGNYRREYRTLRV